jgi:hypothetical protein
MSCGQQEERGLRVPGLVGDLDNEISVEVKAGDGGEVLAATTEEMGADASSGTSAGYHAQGSPYLDVEGEEEQEEVTSQDIDKRQVAVGNVVPSAYTSSDVSGRGVFSFYTAQVAHQPGIASTSQVRRCARLSLRQPQNSTIEHPEVSVFVGSMGMQNRWAVQNRTKTVVIALRQKVSAEVEKRNLPPLMQMKEVVMAHVIRKTWDVYRTVEGGYSAAHVAMQIAEHGQRGDLYGKREYLKLRPFQERLRTFTKDIMRTANLLPPPLLRE